MADAGTLTSLRRDSLDLISDSWPWLARRRLERSTSLAEPSESGLSLTRSALAALRSDLFVDVGANEGVYSWTAKRSGAAIVAFEPHPRLANRLRLAIPTATVVGGALSDRPGLARLEVPSFGRRPVDSRGSIAPGLYDGLRTTTITVPKISLDSALRDLPGRFVLKIDVEGHELETLRGGETIISDRCDMAIVESEERHRIGSPGEVIDWFDSRGFCGWMMLGRRLEPASSFEPESHQRETDRIRLDAGSHPSSGYANNFVFWRGDASEEFGAVARAAGLDIVAARPDRAGM